ncbi:MAG: serine hydrolase domain-containing protein [Pseudomonadota bacterium]
MALAGMGSVLLSTTLGGQAKAAEVEGLASQALRQSGAPGIGLALVDKDQVHRTVTGRAWRGGPRLEPHAQWHLGSLGKAITATLAARLVEAGMIAWDTPLGSVLGPGPFGAVRLQDLLCHRGRLVPNVPNFGAFQGDDLRALRRQATDLLRETEPGPDGYVYSNAGYVVAAAMLEAAADAPFEALLAAHLFASLGLKDVGFGPPQKGPQGHRHLPVLGAFPAGRGVSADNPAFYAPAGTLHMSLQDYGRFLQTHLRRDQSFLQNTTWQRLHRPCVGGSYGLGWNVSDTGVLSHAGSNTLWYAVVALRPGGRALVLVANSGRGAPVERVFTDLWGRLGAP